MLYVPCCLIKKKSFYNRISVKLLIVSIPIITNWFIFTIKPNIKLNLKMNGVLECVEENNEIKAVHFPACVTITK